MDPFPDRGISYSKLITATNSFNNRLGQGATGEVFQGILDEVPIAVKRLRLDDLEKEDVVIALERRFQAEITVLQKYAHARIVRILGFAINEKLPSPYPFAIVLELLKGGSLSDWLRGPNGEPPRRSHHGGGSLSAVERVDIALGAASGLAYLHGLRDIGDRIGEIDECVLHRDIKSANIGLAIHADGTLYAKLLDCGLAKALKGIDKGERSNAAAASGEDLLRNCVSFTGGLVCGTVGYMAPELSQGVYTVLSEVYAFGVVLLELLLGYRVGQRTAALIDEEADNGGIDAIVSRADVIWPLEASKFLTSLTLECISLRERRRPVAIAIILDRLKELRKIIEVAAPKQVLCTVCLDECIEETGVFCTGGVDIDNGGAPGIKHFVCCGCLQVHVITFAEDAAKMRGTGGKVPCVSSGAGGCTATWNITDIGEKLDKATHVVFSKALQHAAFDAPRHKLEQEAALAAAEAAAKEEGLRISEKVRRLRNVIVDRDLTLHCPRCGQAFYDFDGCNALRCKSACGAAFCGLCMVDCGDDAHPHYYSIHRGMNIFDRQAFENAKRDRSKSKLIAAVKAEKGDANVMMALIEELGKADLVDLGLSIDDLKREVQVLEVLPNPLPDVPIELVSLLKKEIIRMNPDYLQKVVSKLWTLLYQKAETKLLCINAQAIEVLTCLAREPFVQNNVKSIEKICGALQCMATLDSGRQECVAQGTIQVLTALGRSTVVKNNASAVYTLVLTLGNIACIDSGLNICLAEKTEIVLTNLALEAAVRIDVQVAAAVVFALCPLAITKVGTLACLACRSLSAVMILLNDGSFQVYTEGVHKAAYFLSLVSHYDEGVVDCNAAGVVEILSSLSRKYVVRNDVDTVTYVADALTNLASSEKGSSAWFESDTTATLTQLCRERNVKESEVALYAVMTALRTIAESERGRSECIRVGTVVTLCSLTHERVIKENERGIHRVYMILSRIVSCDDGRKACLDARVIDALTILIKTNTVKRNVGVAVELVKILDKLSEEIEGHLQCAQAGTVASLTNLSLEPAINRNEYALRLITTTIDNMSVLPDVLPTVPHSIVRICGYACCKRNPSDAKRAVTMLREVVSTSYENKVACINSGAVVILTNLLREAAIKENGKAIEIICGALWEIASNCEAGKTACIKAKTIEAITVVGSETSVKENPVAVEMIAGALACIVNLNSTGQKAVISAGTMDVLISLAREVKVMEDSEAASMVACAIKNIACSDICKNATISAIDALTDLICAPAIKCKSDAIEKIASAIRVIAKIPTSIVKILSCNTVKVLVDVAKEEALRNSSEAAESVARAFFNIAAHSIESKKACVTSRSVAVLTNLLKEKVVKESRTAIIAISGALKKIAEIEEGKIACAAAGTVAELSILLNTQIITGNKDASEKMASAIQLIEKVPAILPSDAHSLVQLLAYSTVRTNAKEIDRVVGKLKKITENDLGRLACVNAKAVSTLTDLLKNEKVVQNSPSVCEYVVWALMNIAVIEEGKISLVSSGTIPVLMHLLSLRAVEDEIEGSRVAGKILGTLRAIASCDSGKAACVAAGAVEALNNLASKNPLMTSEIEGVIKILKREITIPREKVRRGSIARLVNSTRWFRTHECAIM